MEERSTIEELRMAEKVLAREREKLKKRVAVVEARLDALEYALDVIENRQPAKDLAAA